MCVCVYVKLTGTGRSGGQTGVVQAHENGKSRDESFVKMMVCSAITPGWTGGRSNEEALELPAKMVTRAVSPTPTTCRECICQYEETEAGTYSLGMEGVTQPGTPHIGGGGTDLACSCIGHEREQAR